MGSASSTPEPSLDVFSDDEQRTLLRNYALLAKREPANPVTFSAQAFAEVHAAMPPMLNRTLYYTLKAGAPAGADVDCDAVVRTVATLRLESQAPATRRAGLLMLHDAVAAEQATEPVVIVETLRRMAEEASSFLRALPDGAAAPPLPTAPEVLPTPPAHAVASREAWVSWAAGQPPLLSAAALLATAMQAAWLSDLRALQPLPALEEGTSALLRDDDLRLLCRSLAPQHRRRWRLLFSFGRDGVSFTRLVGCISNRSPCLLVIRDESGAVFGGFASEPMHPSPKFQGSSGSMVFRLSPQPEVFRSSGENAHYVYFNHGMEELPNGLAFGGQIEPRFFALWLRDDLERGRSCAPCSTYHSECLAGGIDFRISDVEVWAVGDDPPVEDEDQEENPLEAAGVLAPKHAETRAFLEMAGKKMHSDQTAPPPDQ